MTLALYDGYALKSTQRIHTRPFCTVKQLKKVWDSFLNDHNLCLKNSGLSLSSVVPDYNDLLIEAARYLKGNAFHWVSVDSPHGFSMEASVRHEIGADLIAGLVGARSKYSGPILVIDAGTATTLAILTENNYIQGVAILPGVKTQIKTLMEKAPHLADSVLAQVPSYPYGTSTVQAIQSGIMYGHAYMIEGFIQAYRNLPGLDKLQAIGCGGLFATFAQLCPSISKSEPFLVNDGCLILHLRQEQEGFKKPSNPACS